MGRQAFAYKGDVQMQIGDRFMLRRFSLVKAVDIASHLYHFREFHLRGVCSQSSTAIWNVDVKINAHIFIRVKRLAKHQRIRRTH